MDKQKICAIIPSYKEEKRIEHILKNLEKSIVDEIIVVDDYSEDNTEEIVKKFKKAKYIKNRKNMGKGYSMDKGVKNTNAQILFFCDADIINLKPAMINKIINPVVEKKVEMSIGLRFNVKNKLLLLSGQRALTRDLWERLPSFYKKKFRIEIGLNFYCKNYSYVKLNYSQTIKEKKYGYLFGFYRRFSMMIDIALSVIIFNLNKYIKILNCY